MATENGNFSVFPVVYSPEAGYTLVGRAYDNEGDEVAEWEWQGKTWDGSGVDPGRTGLATMRLRPGKNDNGTGEVEHVGGRRLFARE